MRVLQQLVGVPGRVAPAVRGHRVGRERQPPGLGRPLRRRRREAGLELANQGITTLEEVLGITNEDGADIFVEDNGIGIKEEVQSKVFDMFYRGTDASVGSGLGLYIVKEALDKLNASIKLTSVVGKGTKFAIHLPTL